VIDGQIGFVGGLNIGNEYLGIDKHIGFWRDTHLMMKGEGVRTLQLILISILEVPIEANSPSIMTIFECINPSLNS